MNYANKQIQNMRPYCPPLDNRRNYEGMLLDFNERTVPVSKKVIKALKDFISENKIQVYPEYFDLNAKIGDYTGVSSDQIMITNGSDQGIDLIFRTFTATGDKVIIPSPSFAMFYQCAEVCANETVMPKYYEKEASNSQGELAFPLEEVLLEIDAKTKLVIICNPNNPTGTLVPIEDIKKILDKAKKFGAIVYIDEAYAEFSKISASSLINEYENLIITRTFSKAFGLCALRIGYVITNKLLISEMIKVRGPYDINMAAYFAAKAALDNVENVEDYVNEVMNEAKPMVEKFFRKNDIKYFSSSANFILFKPKDSVKTFNRLKENGILVRPRSGANIEGTIRVTIGTVKEMKKFIKISSNS